MNIRVLIVIILIFMFKSIVFANVKNHKRYYKERDYQHIWCNAHNGIEEYKNIDYTRIDCLTKTHAVEFDFATKWAECVGQSLYYAYLTDKRAKAILIIENPKKQMIYFERIEKLSKIHDFDVEYITPDIFDKK